MSVRPDNFFSPAFSRLVHWADFSTPRVVGFGGAAIDAVARSIRRRRADRQIHSRSTDPRRPFCSIARSPRPGGAIARRPPASRFPKKMCLVKHLFPDDPRLRPATAVKYEEVEQDVPSLPKLRRCASNVYSVEIIRKMELAGASRREPAPPPRRSDRSGPRTLLRVSVSPASMFSILGPLTYPLTPSPLSPLQFSSSWIGTSPPWFPRTSSRLSSR